MLDKQGGLIMTETPQPCANCETMRHHDCRLQSVCTKVKRYYKAEMDSYIIDTIRRNKRRSNKYKGGLQ